jgi:hypothetical protein
LKTDRPQSGTQKAQKQRNKRKIIKDISLRFLCFFFCAFWFPSSFLVLLRRHAEVVKQESVSVGRDFDLLGSARSAVTGFGLDADQHGSDK